MIPLAFVVFGAAFGALAFAPWFAGGPGLAASTLSGVGGASELWSLPLLGTLMVVCGLLIAFNIATGSAVSWTALAGGAMATLWSLHAITNPSVHVIVDRLGADRTVVLPGSMAPVHIVMYAHLAASAAALAALAAIIRLARA